MQNKTYNSYVVNIKNNLEPLVIKGGDNKNEQNIIYSNGKR